QVKCDGSFDEYKVMLGFADGAEAREGYLAHVPEKFLGNMAMTSVEMIKALLGLAPVEVMKRLALDAIAHALGAVEEELIVRKAVPPAQKSGAAELPPEAQAPTDAAPLLPDRKAAAEPPPERKAEVIAIGKA